MNDLLKDPEIIAALQTLGRNLKTPAELVSLNNELTKITIEAALNGEMNAHLDTVLKVKKHEHNFLGKIDVF